MAAPDEHHLDQYELTLPGGNPVCFNADPERTLVLATAVGPDALQAS